MPTLTSSDPPLGKAWVALQPSSVNSKHSYTSKRGVLGQVLIEGHGFQHHLLPYLRSIQKMQAVAFPYGKAQMSDVQARLVARYGYYVAVVNRLS